MNRREMALEFIKQYAGYAIIANLMVGDDNFCTKMKCCMKAISDLAARFDLILTFHHYNWSGIITEITCYDKSNCDFICTIGNASKKTPITQKSFDAYMELFE